MLNNILMFRKNINILDNSIKKILFIFIFIIETKL